MVWIFAHCLCLHICFVFSLQEAVSVGWRPHFGKDRIHLVSSDDQQLVTMYSFSRCEHIYIFLLSSQYFVVVSCSVPTIKKKHYCNDLIKFIKKKEKKDHLSSRKLNPFNSHWRLHNGYWILHNILSLDVYDTCIQFRLYENPQSPIHMNEGGAMMKPYNAVKITLSQLQ